MNLYTKQGDDGTTFCVMFGKKIRKDHPVMEVLGTIDELNSFLGLAYEFLEGEDREVVEFLQKLLFRIGFTVSGNVSVSEKDLEKIEELIDRYWKGVELRNFVLPGGGRSASLLHVARSVTRRLERRLVTVYMEGWNIEKMELLLKLVNRMSDLLFAMAVRRSEKLRTF